jgi:flagellar biosynthesis GTPase FlhF
MSKQPPQQIVKIGISETKTPLTKSQKSFNRLTKRIAEQEKLLVDLRQGIDKGRQRIQTDLLPLQANFDNLRADMVRLLDRMYGQHKWTKTEKKKFIFLITNISYELIQKGHDDLTELHDRYDEGGFEAAMAENEAFDAAGLKMVAEMMFGIQFDPGQDFSDPEQVKAYITEQMQQKAEAQQQQQAEAAERRAQKPKTEKQAAREAKKQAEEQNTTKSVRALYMDLVKTFHPDREPDPTEKERKTGIMQRVTEAYEKSDLMGLLRLQLEFERIDQTHLERLADSQLQYYNKLLKQQVEELDAQLYDLQQEIAMLTGGGGGMMMSLNSAWGLDYAINNDISQLKQDTKALKNDLKSLTDPVALKAWLKMYRVPKADGFEPMGFGMM